MVTATTHKGSFILALVPSPGRNFTGIAKKYRKPDLLGLSKEAGNGLGIGTRGRKCKKSLALHIIGCPGSPAPLRCQPPKKNGLFRRVRNVIAASVDNEDCSSMAPIRLRHSPFKFRRPSGARILGGLS